MHPALFGLTAYSQFIVYRLVPGSRPGKSDKLPVDHRTGRVASAHDPAIWTDLATAQVNAAAWGAEFGIGFVFTESDPFWFLDIDSCLVAGAWSPLALSLCGALSGCAVEVSLSGTGLHIFGTGRPPAHGCRNQALGLEFYHSGRFVALTGAGAVGNCLTDASVVLPALVAQYFPPDSSAGVVQDWTEAPCAEWNGPADDQELIRRAMRPSANNAFGGKASFADLWLANESVLAVSYPDANGRPWDSSAADAALAQHLAFWTGKDCERIRRVMLLSGLVRDKWEREDYLPRTILGAVGRQEAVLGDRAPAPVPAAPGAVLAPSMTVPSGTADELTPEDFWAHLPTHRYINTHTRELIPVDALNGSLKRFGDQLGMKPAQWLDMCRAVQQMNWQPGYPEIIEGMVVDNGLMRPDAKGRVYNLYRPSDAVSNEGDCSPWLDHVRWLYAEEFEHLLCWFAQRIQNPGEKVNHSLVIGGGQGIGKDVMLSPIRYGVGSANFAELNPGHLLESFNDWVESTLLVINEARDLGEGDRYKFYESCKRLIAAPPDTLRCNKKGIGAYYVPNVMGVVFTTNHKLNGIYIDADDRRHYIAWSPVEKREKAYYKKLTDWLDNGGGKEAVVGYLKRLDLSQWDAKAPPPKTEAWHQVVAANANPEETNMSDAIEGIQMATVKEIIAALQFKGHMDLAISLQKNARKVPHILERIGLEILPNPNAKSDGRWRLGDGRKETLYVDRRLTLNERLKMAQARVANPAGEEE